jgi:glycerol transport system ATP-binding protein
MAEIDVNHIRHAYGPNPTSPADYALREVHHTFRNGGAYALLGPSGCGKTTLLNIISGLVHPSHGKLSFDGKDVTELSTQERNIAQVFQFPVIYDTMTVYDNLAFPLRNRGVPEADVDRKVRETLEMIDLASWARRKARGLTADQKQKISLGRGLVRSDVNAVLFDEPLTVIDPHMKWVLRSQLKQLHRRFGYTMVYVTHDQTEAMTLGDRVAVMRAGIIQQVDTPGNLYEKPGNLFVAGFIGSPAMNLVDVGEGRPLKLGDAELVPEDAAAKALANAKGAITIGFRPEALRVGEGPLRAQVRTAEDLGSEVFVHVAVDHLGDQVALVSKMQPPFNAEPGENVTLQITGTTHVFDGDAQRIASGPATLR